MRDRISALLTEAAPYCVVTNAVAERRQAPRDEVQRVLEHLAAEELDVHGPYSGDAWVRARRRPRHVLTNVQPR